MVKKLVNMKKLVFAILAICALVACDHPSKQGKCNDLTELQEAILNNTTDTARYDLNGDGEINIADINYLISTMQSDSTKVKTDTTSSL